MLDIESQKNQKYSTTRCPISNFSFSNFDLIEGEAEESSDEGDVTGEEDAEKGVLLVVPSDTHLDDSPNKLHKPEPKVLDDDDNVDESTELEEGTSGDPSGKETYNTFD